MRKRTAKLADVEQSRVAEESQPQAILTMGEAAAFLGISREKMSYIIRSREIRVIQLCQSHRNIRIYREDLIAWNGSSGANLNRRGHVMGKGRKRLNAAEQLPTPEESRSNEVRTPSSAPRSPSISAGTAEPEILTIAEAARYLKVGRPAIDEAIRNKRLKVIQLCASRRNLRIYKADLLAMRGFVR